MDCDCPHCQDRPDSLREDNSPLWLIGLCLALLAALLTWACWPFAWGVILGQAGLRWLGG